tara:strand:- start:5504 stop:5692 length:189 start_codon:yes stop_codon:yes gene_type:complete
MSEIDNMLATKSNRSLELTMVAELAKSTNELRCAKRDIEKASGRLSFVTAVANELINREKDL